MLNNISIKSLHSPLGELSWTRVISVKQELNLTELHEIIIKELGFWDEHLFQFIVNDISLDEDYIEDCFQCREHYKSFKLCDLLTTQGTQLFYNYDFGDNWIFEIKQTINSPINLRNKNYRIIKKIGNKVKQYPKVF